MVQADKTVSCRRGEALPAATAMGADWTLSTSSLRPPGGPLWLLPSDGSFQCGFCSTRKHLKLSISLRNVLVSYVNVLCINKKTYWFTFIYLYILEKKMQLSWFSPFSFQATLWCHWTGTGAAWKRAEVKEHDQKCCRSGIRHPCRVKIAWLKTSPVIKKAHCMRLHSWNISSPVVCFNETYHQPTSR